VRILSHYFVARFLGLFVLVLVSAILVLATIELVLNFEDISSFGAESQSVFRYLWVRLASYYVPDLIPIASFFAAFLTFGWAGRTMELIATQSGGIRTGRLVAPVLVSALILSLATAILHETLVLRAKQIWSVEARGGGQELDFDRRGFWVQKGRIVSRIDHADRESRTLYGVEIFERAEEGRILRVIRADRVEIGEQGHWNARDARVWRFDPSDPAIDPRVEEHASLTLERDSFGGRAPAEADAAALPIRSLTRHLELNPDETPSGLRRLRGTLHDRISDPWLVGLFAALALPFALRIDRRGNFARPAVEGAATLGAYFLLRSAGTTLAREGLFPVGLTPWLVIALFSFWTLWSLRRSAL